MLVGCGSPKAPLLPEDAGTPWDKCRLPGASPKTIQQVVDRINALPRPVDIPCVVAGLPRPLAVVASTSIFSAQPAEGRRSPRMFLMLDGLILAVVPEGTGRHLLEFGQIVAAGRTVKAELAFPIDGGVANNAPFDEVMMGPTQTNCALCHRFESPHDAGFSSVGFKPDPGNLVPLSELRQQLAACDFTAEKDRCDLLYAVFGFGIVTDGKFPAQFELFVQ